MNILIAFLCCAVGWLAVVLTDCKPITAFLAGWGLASLSQAIMAWGVGIWKAQ